MTARRTAVGSLLFAFVCGILAVRLEGQTDGSVRWSFKTSGFVASSPAISADGTHIYVGVETNTTPSQGSLFAFNTRGSIQWQWDVPQDKTNPVDSMIDAAPALAADGTIYVLSGNGKLYAVADNGTSGSEQWEFNTGSTVTSSSSPVVGPDGTVYIVSDDFVLHAVEPKKGAQKWQHAAGFGFDPSPAIAADGTVYLSSGDENFLALNPADGSEKWPASVGGFALSAPAIGLDGTIYTCVTTGASSDGRVIALSPNDGTMKWTYQAGVQIAAAPVVGADGTIYFGATNGLFYALNQGDGSLKWQSSHTGGNQIVSTAAVRGDGTIIFGANDYAIHALNPDGTQKWSQKTADIVQSSPVVAADGTIYVGSFDARLYAINGSGSPLSAYASWPMLHGNPFHSGTARAPVTGAQLFNLSTYAPVAANSSAIAGFVVRGTVTKNFLVRASGPALAAFGVPNGLPNPALLLQAAPSGAFIGANDNWSDTSDNFLQVASADFLVGAFPLPVGSKDAALVALFAPGGYTAIVGSADGGSGVALVETYDMAPDSPDARLINLSTRATLRTDATFMTAGLVVRGTGSIRVLVRAVGPSLSQFNVAGTLSQPSMVIYNDSQKIIQSITTGWTSQGFKGDLAGAAQIASAFPLLDGSADCAAIVTLTSGNYTLVVSGLGSSVGTALVEVYAIP